MDGKNSWDKENRVLSISKFSMTIQTSTQRIRRISKNGLKLSKKIEKWPVLLIII